MAYTPNADDVTIPLLSTLAGTAQADFIALKQKLNNVFLVSQYNAGLNQQALQSGLTYVKSLPAGIDTGIMYGFAADILRNDISVNLRAVNPGGPAAVAAQFNARLGNNLNGLADNISIFGIATEAWTSEVASHATLIGLETSIIAQYNDNQMALLGLDVVYKNRADGVAAVVQGLGANHYNTNTRAIQISSQLRSSAGEYAGWNKGIQFTAGCFDYALVGGVPIPAIALDVSSFSAVPATQEPWTAYRMSSALALSEYMSITWDALQFTRTWLDSVGTTFWIFGSGNSPTTVPQLGWDYNNGYIVSVSSVAGAATAGAATLPANPVGFKLEKIGGTVRKIPYYAI